jgi:hypothetical protein
MTLFKSLHSKLVWIILALYGNSFSDWFAEAGIHSEYHSNALQDSTGSPQSIWGPDWEIGYATDSTGFESGLFGSSTFYSEDGSYDGHILGVWTDWQQQNHNPAGLSLEAMTSQRSDESLSFNQARAELYKKIKGNFMSWNFLYGYRWRDYVNNTEYSNSLHELTLKNTMSFKSRTSIYTTAQIGQKIYNGTEAIISDRRGGGKGSSILMNSRTRVELKMRASQGISEDLGVYAEGFYSGLPVSEQGPGSFRGMLRPSDELSDDPYTYEELGVMGGLTYFTFWELKAGMSGSYSQRNYPEEFAYGSNGLQSTTVLRKDTRVGATLSLEKKFEFEKMDLFLKLNSGSLGNTSNSTLFNYTDKWIGLESRIAI